MNFQHRIAMASVIALVLSGCSSGEYDASGSSAAISANASEKTPIAASERDRGTTNISAEQFKPTPNAADLTAFSEVTLGVLKVSAVSNTGEEVILFNSSTPVRHNATSVSEIRDFISRLPGAMGVSAPVTLTLADDIVVMRQDGTTFQARLSGNGLPSNITLAGNLRDQPGGMLVAMNLARFSYDDVSGRVMTVNEQKNLTAAREAIATAELRSEQPRIEAR